ncbi:MAG TPA: response regulator transcription factor [Candidatus Limnocylindrales bacterium]|nr:response regulator transcription factor [Candidatus Limnocylindrales bacterium]
MRAVIVEDHSFLLDLMAKGLPLMGVDVVGQARDVPTAIDVIEHTLPEVVILDMRLPPGQRDEGLTIAETVRARHPQIGILVLSAYGELAAAERLLNMEHDSRAVGYVKKDQIGDLTRLTEHLRRIAAGEVVIDSTIVDQLMKRHRTRDPLATLTPTERRVLALVAEGHSNTGIAEKLGQRVCNIEKYVSTIAAKLGLPSRDTPQRRSVNIRVLAVLMFLRSGTVAEP